MLRRKLIAGVAAIAAAGAIAVPAASASAQPAYSSYFGCGGEYQCGFCLDLVRQIQFADATGNTAWASALGNVFVYSHCGGAAL